MYARSFEVDEESLLTPLGHHSCIRTVHDMLLVACQAFKSTFEQRRFSIHTCAIHLILHRGALIGLLPAPPIHLGARGANLGREDLVQEVLRARSLQATSP